MKTIEVQMHLASQYLAAAAISFLEPKEDDSHTNLGFDEASSSLCTHQFSQNKDQLCLNYKDFSLEWKSTKQTHSFSLHSATHSQALKWISNTSQALLKKEFHYRFHYDLPYKLNASDVFIKNEERLKELILLRTLANKSLKDIKGKYHLNAAVRIWPHHFDTGIYSKLNKSSVSVGLGMAIPDEVCDTHYFYISGYNDSGQIAPTSFKKLSNGEWLVQNFKGAVLPVENITKTEVNQFFEEAIEQYKKRSL